MRRWSWIGLGATALLGTLAGASAAAPKRGAASAQVRRGEYLVTISGCNDCHTPWKMGPNGPENDRSRLLSGHPQELAIMEPPPPGPGPWIAAATGTFTAWSGPWGVSFTPNLTPDPETGLGKWTVQNFIEAMRSGRHMGRGRPILPPMPWQGIGQMTDDDLKATFAYLRSIPPIQNRVPEPIDAPRPRMHGPAPERPGATSPDRPATGAPPAAPVGGPRQPGK